MVLAVGGAGTELGGEVGAGDGVTGAGVDGLTDVGGSVDGTDRWPELEHPTSAIAITTSADVLIIERRTIMRRAIPSWVDAQPPSADEP